MSTTVVLAKNPLDPSSWERHEAVKDVTAFLIQELGQWPDGARIYHEQVAREQDVTPRCPEDVAVLQALEGTLYVVLYPGAPLTIIAAVIAVAAVAAAAFLLVPPVPNSTARNNKSESPNNALSERVNQPRINGRIPDIFGTVRSTPDLLAVPYKVFKNHREVEVAYMCVGRGEYDVSDVRDDTTPVSSIEGMSVEVYGPNTSPLSGDPAQLTIGDAITDPLLNARRSTAVNGQTIYPNNYKKVIGTDNFRAVSGGRMQVRDTSVFAFTQLYEVGDMVTITNGTVDGKALSGTYEVTAVSDDYLTFLNPATVAPAWSTVSSSTTWYGPTFQIATVPNPAAFYVDIETGGTVIINLVALSGLYAADSDGQYALDVSINFQLQPVDGAGVPTGAPSEYMFGTVAGSATSKSTRALTLTHTIGTGGRFAITATRSTDTDYGFNGSIVDEVKWRDLYLCNPIAETDFGDVTTVFAVTYGTDGALAIKERKLNLLASRKLHQSDGMGGFGVTATATNDVGQILIAAAMDPKIGNRPASELDVAGILATSASIQAYFGTADASSFCYTFDNQNLTLEETLAVIAGAAYSTAYRRGSVISMTFERENPDSVLLFNHRNKVPATETRTVVFGVGDGYDGVALEYVDPEDDAVVTIYVPQGDASAVNPKKIETVGVRNIRQAHFHAWRAWNKLRYQTTTTEFEALQEADILVPTDRILVADNTRPETVDGDVIGQDGLLLTLSQPVELDALEEYTIFLQSADGLVESRSAVQGPEANQVVLDDAPSLPLSVDNDLSYRATYVIVGPDGERTAAPFLLAEKDPQDGFTVGIMAINYDARYYQNDGDHIAELI